MIHNLSTRMTNQFETTSYVFLFSEMIKTKKKISWRLCAAELYRDPTAFPFSLISMSARERVRARKCWDAWPQRGRERERERDNQLRKCSLGGYPFPRSTLRTWATKLRWRQKSSIGRRFSKETSLTKTSSLSSSSSASTVDVLNVRKTFFKLPKIEPNQRHRE